MTPWETFYKEKVTFILTDSKSVVDVGGGLRISKVAGNRYDPRHRWMEPLLSRVEYTILDTTPTYHPDIIGDIQALPFEDDSQEAIVCLSVLESVEDPMKAMHEIRRVLKQGGYAFLYVPFLYYYHAEKGYYKDFWRFSEDAISYLCKDFSLVEIQKLHGAIETWIKISPLGRSRLLLFLARIGDVVFRKTESKQTSGFYVFLKK